MLRLPTAILCLLLFCPGLNTFAQDIRGRHPQVTSLVKQIDRDTSLQKVILTNEEFMPQMTDGGGELTGYFKNGIIQKITREIGLSYGIETYEYYFSKGSLIYIHETLNGFIYDEKSDSVDHSKTELNFTGHYYFRQDKLIDHITIGHNRFEDDSIDMEKVLVKEAKESRNLIERAGRPRR